MSRQKNDGKGRLGGRSRGTPNKITTSLKEWLKNLLERNATLIEEDFKKLDPPTRIRLFEKLLTYALPKQASVQSVVKFEELSDEQLDEITKRLIGDMSDEDTNR